MVKPISRLSKIMSHTSLDLKPVTQSMRPLGSWVSTVMEMAATQVVDSGVTTLMALISTATKAALQVPATSSLAMVDGNPPATPGPLLKVKPH